MALKIVHAAFEDGQLIPRRYSGDGEDVSPPLAWSDPPAGTKSFALIGDDPDVPRGERVLAACHAHALAETQLIGKYQR